LPACSLSSRASLAFLCNNVCCYLAFSVSSLTIFSNCFYSMSRLAVLSLSSMVSVRKPSGLMTTSLKLLPRRRRKFARLGVSSNSVSILNEAVCSEFKELELDRLSSCKFKFLNFYYETIIFEIFLLI